MSFPLTDFDNQLRFAPKPYAERLEWLMPYGTTLAVGLVGHSAGPVRPPLSELKPAQCEALLALIERLGTQ